MFDIGWTEILVVAVVAIVVFPSKDLPKLLRTTGQMVGRVRRMAGDFQSQFNSALREAEREVDLEDTRNKIGQIKDLNPMGDVKKALNPLRSAGDEIRKSLTGSGPTSRAPSQFVPPTDAGTTASQVPAPVDVPAPPVVPAGPPAIKAPETLPATLADARPADAPKPRKPAASTGKPAAKPRKPAAPRAAAAKANGETAPSAPKSTAKAKPRTAAAKPKAAGAKPSPEGDSR